MHAANPQELEQSREEAEKMLGALVPESVYWAFRTAASNRKEKMQEAILNAALLYLDAKPNNDVSKEGV